MKPKEVREMSIDQLKQQLISKEEELFNLKIQLATKQLENPMKIGKLALPWSAVIARMPPASRTACSSRPRHWSSVSSADDRRIPHAGVADHVGVGVVHDDHVVVPSLRRLRPPRSVMSAGRHLGSQIVGRDRCDSTGSARDLRPGTRPRGRR